MPQTDIPTAQRKARALGYEVRASKVRNKKLAVYKDGVKVADIGDKRYSDFLQHKDSERRARYHARHGAYPKGTPGWLAGKILW